MPILINKSAKPIRNKVNRQKSSDPQKFPVDEQSRNRLVGAKPGVVGNHRIELFQPPQKITALKSPHQFVGALYNDPLRLPNPTAWTRLASLGANRAPPAKQQELRRYQALMSRKDIKEVAKLRDAPIHPAA